LTPRGRVCQARRYSKTSAPGGAAAGVSASALTFLEDLNILLRAVTGFVFFVVLITIAIKVREYRKLGRMAKDILYTDIWVSDLDGQKRRLEITALFSSRAERTIHQFEIEGGEWGNFRDRDFDALCFLAR
jgi:hypothetical protein